MQMKNFLKIAVAFALCLFIGGCMNGKGGSRGGVAPQTQTQTQTQTPPAEVIGEEPSTTTIAEHPVVNVYLENSGSMNGYVDNGKTLFQQDVYNYLCDIHISGIASEINLHFINSQIINKGSVIEDFINGVDVEKIK